MRRHLANPDPTKFVRRGRRRLVAVGYPRRIQAARERTSSLVVPPYRPKAVAALHHRMVAVGVRRSVTVVCKARANRLIIGGQFWAWFAENAKGFSG